MPAEVRVAIFCPRRLSRVESCQNILLVQRLPILTSTLNFMRHKVSTIEVCAGVLAQGPSTTPDFESYGIRITEK